MRHAAGCDLAVSYRSISNSCIVFMSQRLYASRPKRPRYRIARRPHLLTGANWLAPTAFSASVTEMGGIFWRRIRLEPRTPAGFCFATETIAGSEDRGPRDRRGAHTRWWKGLWKNRRRYRWRKSGEVQRGLLTRPGATRCFYRLSMTDGKS